MKRETGASSHDDAWKCSVGGDNVNRKRRKVKRRKSHKSRSGRKEEDPCQLIVKVDARIAVVSDEKRPTEEDVHSFFVENEDISFIVYQQNKCVFVMHKGKVKIIEYYETKQRHVRWKLFSFMPYKKANDVEQLIKRTWPVQT